MQMSQMFPSLSPDNLSGSGSSGAQSGADGSGFGNLHERILGGAGDGSRKVAVASSGESGRLPLAEGDVLKDGGGRVIGRIVGEEDGGLALVLEGGKGDPISLERLLGLFESGGSELLQRFMDGEAVDGAQLLSDMGLEADSENAGTDLITALNALDDSQREGVLAALNAMTGDERAVRSPGAGNGGNSLLGVLGLENPSAGNSSGNGAKGSSSIMQAILNGDFTPRETSADNQTASRFEVFSRGGGDSGGRGEMSATLQQNVARASEARESPLKQYTTSVETPVQQQGKWGEQVSSKIAWMAGRNIQSADIQLNPPEMGPIDVRVQVNNDQATINVNAQNNAVRDMLELNSNRLREMLAENGMNLAEFDVSGNGAQGEGGAESEDSDDGRDAGRAMVSQDNETVATGSMTVTLPDGVDTYA